MFGLNCGIFILVLFSIVPIYTTDGCSTNCTLKDGKRTVGNRNTDAPKMKFKTTTKSVNRASSISLKCRICQSNPASTITWLFNEHPLQFKADRMDRISTQCQDTLYLLTVLNEDEGNYTCVAKNEFGEATSTTELKVFGKGCSDKCLWKDGKLKTRDSRAGPPRTIYKQLLLVNMVNDMVKISCPVCKSNPPSKITWYYNRRPLDLENNRIQVNAGHCEESLLFNQALRENSGNYTCIVENNFGQAKSTTELRVLINDKEKPRFPVKLEAEAGTIKPRKRENNERITDVKIGSSINITCAISHPNCSFIHWSWRKNDEVVTTQVERDTYMKKCGTKLIISNVMVNSSGKYTCSVTGWAVLNPNVVSENHAAINAVSCFQSFYCPPTSREAKRCPNDTFTTRSDATKLKQCEPCSTYQRNMTFLVDKDKNSEIANLFEVNCRNTILREATDESSSLSNGQIIAITISLIVLAVVLAFTSFYGRRKYRDQYKQLRLRPTRNIPTEIPDVPQCKDVFVCYSSKNRNWVHETLLPNLRAQDFETFIDIIDFEIGLPIHQNIVKGIYGSRRTIFVLSKDSLKSYYARTELSQALAAGRQTGHQVIVILYEKCKVPEEISDIVYLDWTHEEGRDQFWEKLYEAVRKPLENDTL